ncbi:hypothetical protein CSB95_0218 [Pseudomonas aeruginosa]|nr:hypothetical protein CSC31_1579 [Pseudomonas aeruginosa]AWE87978.1 hypothetical protein CSC29_3794 [Pseudomonas aeruginosa]PRW06162.1 hypothetical protein CSB95_0218 [Pseudomonas aeruginosa]
MRYRQNGKTWERQLKSGEHESLILTEKLKGWRSKSRQ